MNEAEALESEWKKIVSNLELMDALEAAYESRIDALDSASGADYALAQKAKEIQKAEDD